MALAAEITSFYEELTENLALIETATNRLDEYPSDSESLKEIFRAAHSIKGNASMMNLAHVVALAHALETLLSEAIDGRVATTADVLNAIAATRQIMQQIGDALKSGKTGAELSIRETTDIIQALLLSTLPQATKGERSVEIKLRIAAAELAPSVRAFLVETKLSELGKIIARTPAEETLESPQFIAGDRQIHFTLETSVDIAEIHEHLNIDLIEALEIHEGGATRRSEAPQVERARAVVERDLNAGPSDTIRLGVKVLDRLMNLTGELVIANGGLLDISDSLNLVEEARADARLLSEKNREIFRISAEIQSLVMKARMLPIENVFSRFKRFVRDYADNAGKAIRLEISGAETELDKRVIDEIVKPLTHILRNSLDHGFETPSERIAQGKNAEGTLKISAAQSGGNILIALEDDGRGMDEEKILRRAIEKGLVDAAAARTLAPEAIREFIFLPGFSTKESADDLSGRGFGMDIVRDSIKKLSGELSIQSTKGKGTRMVIRLPLTLAILTALTFRIRNDTFAIPLTAIEESLRVPTGSIMTLERREVLHTKNAVLPFVRLDRALGYAPISSSDEHAFVIITEIQDRLVALGVDELIKKQELVVKSIDENYAPVRGLAGAAILGNSEIIFIVDVPEIIALYEENYALLDSRETRHVTNTRIADATIITENPMQTEEIMSKTSLIDITDKELVKKWILQSNKTAVQGIQMLTGKKGIAVKRSKGQRVKRNKSKNLAEKISVRAEEIYLIHLPMLPAAGAIDLILNRRDAELMANLMMDAAGIANPSGFDPSPLLEITNILGSAYTNSLAFITNKSVEPATPTFLATAYEIRQLVDERLRAPKGEILVVENEFHIESDDIEVELVIYLEG